MILVGKKLVFRVFSEAYKPLFFLKWKKNKRKWKSVEIIFCITFIMKSQIYGILPSRDVFFVANRP